MTSSLPIVASALFSLGLLGSPALAADAGPAAGDAAHGQQLFKLTCALCHATGTGVGPAGGQGPSLAGILGRKAASAPNFGYTKALTDSGLVWNRANLARFLANPTSFVPGTNMLIPVPNPQDRADLIAYLATLPAASGATSAAAAPAETTDESDWRHASPGTKYVIDPATLPPPYSTQSARNNPSVVARPAGATLAVPAGFTVTEFTHGLSGPRLIHLAPNGDLFISETRANRIRVLRAADGATSPSADEVFASGVDRPFGMAFYPAGDNPQWIYVANNNEVVRFPYRNGDLKARGGPEVIVPKLADTTSGHTTRDVIFSPDGTRLYISIGSNSNVAEGLPAKSPAEIRAWERENARGAAWGPETRRANIVFTDPSGRAPLRIFATGIRNPVALALDASTGELWTSTNERDELGDNLVPDYATHVQEGAFYGWPWYYIGNHEDPRHAGERPDLAGQVTVPDVPVQSHSAPLGIAFYPATATGGAAFPAEYRGDLFVALHGSWNRASRTGYKVVRVRFKDGHATGEYDDFLTGFVISSRSVWGRPVGVTVARDGALLVTEDGNGTVWRIAYTGR